MPIDPNISLQVGNNVRPLDPIAAYGQVLTLKNAIDAQRMNGLQYDKTLRDMEDQQAIRSAYVVRPDGTIDEGATTQALVRQGFGPQAVDFRHKSALDSAARSKAEREAEKARLDAVDAKNKIIGQELAALGPNPTYASAMDAGLRLVREHGLQFDLNEIPEDPAKLSAFVRDHAMRAVKVEQQIAERRAAMEPKTQLGQLLRDRELYGQRREDGNSAADRPIGSATDTQGGGIRTGEVTGMPPVDPFAARIAREQYGNADEPFYYDNQGRVQPRQNVQDFQRAKARDSAANIGLNTYEKELNKQDAQAVSDSRKGAEQAASAASDARAIAQILKGQNSGKWTEMQAALGGWLPNTPYAKVTSIVSLAEGIRARAAPALRVPGSGAMSDFETKQLLGIFPQLLQSDDGRELAARVLERVADRQAIAADIKDEMVRGGSYSVKKFNDAVKAQFGDGLLEPEEKDMLKRLQGAGRKTPSSGGKAPTMKYNPATGKIE